MSAATQDNRCRSCHYFVRGGEVTCANQALAEQFAPQMLNKEQLIRFMNPAQSDRCSLHEARR
jgi:hypothetical protein